MRLPGLLLNKLAYPMKILKQAGYVLNILSEYSGKGSQDIVLQEKE